MVDRMSRRGATLVLVAILMTVIIGFAGSLAVWALYEGVIRMFRSMRGTSRQTADVFG